MDPAWVEYRRRWRANGLAILLALVWMVPGSLIRSVLVRCGWNDGAAFFLAVALPALGTVFLAQLRVIRWPCPRCGRPFLATWYYSNSFARRCVHCGLPKWAAGSERADRASSSP